MRAKAQRAVKEYETFQVETGGQDVLATTPSIGAELVSDMWHTTTAKFRDPKIRHYR